MATIDQRGDKWRVQIRKMKVKCCRTFPSLELAQQWALAKETELWAAANPPEPGVETLLARAIGDDLTAEQILVSAHPVKIVPGVYFLISEGKIVYVGQSNNVLRRVATHTSDTICTGKFDSYAYISCDVSSLNTVEQHYIRKFNPPLNLHHANHLGIRQSLRAPKGSSLN